jgi:hypothetical protein
MPRWSAAQMLAYIARGEPLKLAEWPRDMDGQILPAQLKLREAIAQQRICDVRGGRASGSKERIEELPTTRSRCSSPTGADHPPLIQAA